MKLITTPDEGAVAGVDDVVGELVVGGGLVGISIDF